MSDPPERGGGRGAHVQKLREYVGCETSLPPMTKFSAGIACHCPSSLPSRGTFTCVISASHVNLEITLGQAPQNTGTRRAGGSMSPKLEAKLSQDIVRNVPEVSERTSESVRRPGLGVLGSWPEQPRWHEGSLMMSLPVIWSVDAAVRIPILWS